MSHSLACNLSMWDDQMAVLVRKFKVLRFDTRGHGASSAPPGPYTLDELADEVYGLIGETFALKYPGVFESMVLADTTSRRPPNAEQMWGERVRLAQERGMEALV